MANKEKDKIGIDDIDFNTVLDSSEEEDSDELELEEDPNEDSSEDDDVIEDPSTDDEDDPDGEDDDEVDEDAEEDSDESDDESENDDDDEGSDEDSEEDIPLVNEIATSLGLELDEDEEIEDTVDGVREVARRAAEQLSDQQVNELFDAMPDVKQFLQYRLNGGDAAQYFETFHKEVDYSNTQLDEEDEVLQERLVRDDLALREMDEEDISNSVKRFKSAGLLKEQAEVALKNLSRHQEAEQARLLEEQARVAEEAEKQRKEFVGEVQNIIQESGDFHGIPVSEKEKTELYKYATQIVDDGQTQFQLALNDAPLETYLAFAKLLKSGFDLSGLVDRKASTKKAKSLREKLRKKEREKMRSKEESSNEIVSNPDLNELQLDL